MQPHIYVGRRHCNYQRNQSVTGPPPRDREQQPKRTQQLEYATDVDHGDRVRHIGRHNGRKKVRRNKMRCAAACEPQENERQRREF